MITIPHRAIRASAGSGKTFQLAHRYVQLLALGEPGDRIIALTFSRKAAGEIFDAVAGLLCAAACSEETARETSARIGLPHLVPADYLGLLRALIDTMPRLHIGTLDSFTVGVLRSFPMELGLTGELALLDEGGVEAARIREEILRRLFNHRCVTADEQADFHEAYKQATFGREQKGVQRTLTDFITRYHGRYQELPLARGWGDAATIWGGPCPCRADAAAARVAAQRLLTWLPAQGFSAKAAARWAYFIDCTARHDRHSPWPSGPFTLLFERLVKVTDDLRRGRAEVTVDRCTCVVEGEACAEVLALLGHVTGVELQGSLASTAGLFRVLQQYERMYDHHARRRGRMTFSDAQMLLAGRYPGGAGYTLSRSAGAPDRLYIDYRLDAQLDHWLLDEFQDTSDLQWEVLENLVDEILTDPAGRRTLFYVGDVKQAIYGWRGGNAHLFTDLLARYGGRIEEYPLHKSFRSCPAVIEAVNEVFNTLPADTFPEGVLARWAGDWVAHETARQGLSGCTVLVEPPPGPDGAKPGAMDRYRVTAALLNEIRPVERGLTTAILVRSNAQGVAVIDALRRYAPGLPVVFEGTALFRDNMVVNLMLALVRAAVHPGDTLAWGHLAMSPLYPVLEREGLGRDHAAVRLLEELRQHGARGFFRRWGQRLQEVVALDEFGVRRLRDLEDAATVFDLREAPEAAQLLPLIEAAGAREIAGDHTVRVMTMHQSKGLGFDIVLLPELQGGAMDGGRQPDLMVSRDPRTRCPRWMLKPPQKPVAEHDPVLAAALRDAEEEQCFEQLCLLYVAMTRAKRGLYVVTSYPGPSSKAFTPAALLKRQWGSGPNARDAGRCTVAGEAVDVLYERGDARWYETASLPEAATPAAVPELAADYARRPAARRRPERVRPSEEGEGETDVEQALEPARIHGRRFGQALHELFERVTWLDETDPVELAATWKSETRLPSPQAEGVARRFLAVMADPALVALFQRPEGAMELWREKRFEIIVDNRWISGVFDRVILRPDPETGARRAEIIDFKSNRIAGEEALRETVALYRPQMEEYRRVLSRLAGLPGEAIRLRLLFTHALRAVEV